MPLAELVADACGLEFKYEWYGLPDHRSYRVSFKKIKEVTGYEPIFTLRDGAKEVYKAIVDGKIDPDNPKTITVEWYKRLLETQKILKQVEIDGVLL